VSVVIAARNEEKLIGFCLHAVAEQDFPFPYELIVVDNASFDRTAFIASQFPCRLIREPEPNQLLAKHAGVSAARADIVVVLDADCVPGHNWLANIYQAMTSKHGAQISAVTCCYRYKCLPLWGFVYDLVGRVALVGLYRLLLRTMPFVVGGNVAFRRACYLQNGGYPLAGGIAQTELGIAKRLNQCGRIHYLPSMAVYSSTRRFQSGIAQFFKYKLMDYLIPYFCPALLFSPLETVEDSTDDTGRA
jgi:glycosyltransferase involved in cell wall biosynthesis